MVVDDALILKLQNLAKLDLSKEEAESMKLELEKVISMFDTIAAVDTEGLDPLIYLSDVQDNWREDEIQEGISVQTLSGIAPLMYNHAVAVPKVIET